MICNQTATNPFCYTFSFRCFRIDRVYRAITLYVITVMGDKFVMPPITSFDAIYDQSSPISPIVFILSPGSDPATDLVKLADNLQFGSNKLKFLSMGQGQEKVSPLVSPITPTDTMGVCVLIPWGSVY